MLNNYSALIGHTGFVGSTLQKQRSFNELYNSTNISDIQGKHFDLIVCAGAPAQKWLANKNPLADKAQINNLIGYLKNVSCKLFILISTVDVFKEPYLVNENSIIDTEGLHAYGTHRYDLEIFVKNHFPNFLIVRLCGLVGPDLRKNIIYDLHHQNNIHLIDKRSTFQFYPMVNLWHDINIAINNHLSLIHLTAEPTQVSEIATECFNIELADKLENPPIKYDIQSCYAHLFNSCNQNYQYNKKEVLTIIRAYAQSEPENNHANRHI